jgi:hypothetical protein
MPIVIHDFTRAFTLGVYRQWRGEETQRLETKQRRVCESVVESAKILAG